MMRTMNLSLLLALGITLLAATSSACAADRIPVPVWPEAKRQDPQVVAAQIDRLIEARLTKEKIPFSPLADDAEFLRRVHLDLIGRIPTPDRAAAFLDSKDPDKRGKLIDELLADKEYGKNFANVWHDLIIPRTPIFADIKPEALRTAFAPAFQENMPWSDIVAKVILCDGGTAESNFLAFYRVNGDMGGKPMANVVSRSFTRLFLGSRMECAECHDDPYKPWTQKEYWGIAAHFGRVMLRKDSKNGPKMAVDIVEDRGYLPPKGNNFRLTVKADGGLVIHMESRTDVGKSVLPAVPGGQAFSYSAGQPMLPSLVNWVRSPDNPYLARAAANRWWAHLFSRGLVNPVDDFYEGNEASHPELLKLLTAEFTNSHHDLKHLIRCICNSKTYQRTSQPVAGNDRVDDPLFSRMPLKVLTAEMLLDSLGVACSNSELFPRTAPPVRRGSPPPFTRKHFIALFNTNDVEGDPTDYNHGVPQVLHLMNGPLNRAAADAAARLLKDKSAPESVIETLYLATLSRRPTADEMKRKLALVGQHKTREEGLAGVLWTLINQSEFIVNH